MNKLRMGLPLVIALGWAVGAGCDDDRGVVDLGAGGSDGTPTAGESAAPGGAGAGGVGVGGAGAGSVGGAAGAGGVSECPADIFDAEGKACAPDGLFCSDGSDDPCGFGQSIMCNEGKWQRQEAFPGDCEVGGAGGQGSAGAGAGDAAGAGGAP